MLVNNPSDLLDFVATTGNFSEEGGEERTAMEDEDGERGTVGEETQDSVISHSDSCPTPVHSIIVGDRSQCHTVTFQQQTHNAILTEKEMIVAVSTTRFKGKGTIIASLLVTYL